MGVIAVVAVVALWWVATHGKGGVALRLIAWGSAVVVVWVLVGFKDPHEAGAMASDFVTGIGQAASAFGKFLGML